LLDNGDVLSNGDGVILADQDLLDLAWFRLRVPHIDGDLVGLDLSNDVPILNNVTCANNLESSRFWSDLSQGHQLDDGRCHTNGRQNQAWAGRKSQPAEDANLRKPNCLGLYI
jgi:hypothetical protein